MPDERDGSRSARQLRLIPYVNPLTERLGADFFKNLPRTPGVYRMYGLEGSLLYVGKAKDLRARLSSYRNARPEKVSRKVIRLIHVIDEIRIETCESEAAALLRENELLRGHKPPFNVVNTSPESYYFVALRERSGSRRKAQGSWLDFRLTTNPEIGADWDRDSFFGAFKGRHGLREAYQALLRLLWACHSPEARQGGRFAFPGCLVTRKVPYSYTLSLRADCPDPEAREWASLLRRFFKGTSDALLKRMTEQLLAQEGIPPFYYRAIQEDLERLQRFYEWGPARHRRVRRELGSADHLIPQDRVDDMWVMYKARRNQRF